MPKTYIDQLDLPSDDCETMFFFKQKRTCYNVVYPFKLFPRKGLESIKFHPITIFYGGNGSGKSTLLNVIAEKTNIIRHSPFNSSAFFHEYISRCVLEKKSIPKNSQILTSDDVSDYLLNIRCLNDGIDFKREELFKEYLDRRYSEHRLKSLKDYDNWKDSSDAKTKSQSQFVKNRLMRNVDMQSNGESAMQYFVEHIAENALYLLDEPENSLSISLQLDLRKYICDSARHFGCQFAISTHSPVFLSMENAVIYDLDSNPVITRKWTELENVRQYYEFFQEHQEAFEASKQ